jgi:hypothetical protein
VNWNAREPERGTRYAAGGQGRSTLPDLRPASPGQLALIGGGLLLAGWLIPALGFLSLFGVVALLVAGLTYLVRPRTREMYWRGRRIDIGGPPTLGERFYRAIYRG